MKKRNILILTGLIMGSSLFTGCASTSESYTTTTTEVTTSSPSIKTQKVDVFSDTYRLGLKEGCKTAKGYYSKDYYKYNSNTVYKQGWYEGMRQCRQKGKYVVAY